MHMMFRVTTAAVVTAAALVSFSVSSWAADISVQNVWARASAGAVKNGAAFLTIQNTGASDDAVVSASTTVCDHAELHTHIKDGTVMRMRQVENIPVPAGQTVMLKPGGLHVMLMGLSHPLKEGETFPLTLTFEKAGSIETTATVQGPGAMGMHMAQ